MERNNNSTETDKLTLSNSPGGSGYSKHGFVAEGMDFKKTNTMTLVQTFSLESY